MSEKPQPPEKPKLRWYQYRLAHLFIFVTICAIPCSWFACKMAEANRRKEAVAAIRQLGGEVHYDYEYDADDEWIPDAKPPGPAWLRNFVGLDFLADVVIVGLSADPFRPQSYPEVTDDWVEEHIGRLTKLDRLDLGGTQVTDAGLEHLTGMARLKWLNLNSTQVGDAGVEHIEELPHLEAVWLYGTQVSVKGLRKLQEASPNCIIYASQGPTASGGNRDQSG